MGKEKGNSAGEILGWPSTSTWGVVTYIVAEWELPPVYRNAPKTPAWTEQLLSTTAKDLGLEKRKAECSVATAVVQVKGVLSHPNRDPKAWDPSDASSDNEEDMWEDVIAMGVLDVQHTCPVLQACPILQQKCKTEQDWLREADPANLPAAERKLLTSKILLLHWWLGNCFRQKARESLPG